MMKIDACAIVFAFALDDHMDETRRRRRTVLLLVQTYGIALAVAELHFSNQRMLAARPTVDDTRGHGERKRKNMKTTTTTRSTHV